MLRAVLLVLTTLTFIQPAHAQLSRWQAEGWRTDFDTAIVDFESITNVIFRDQIPSIDEPQFQPISDETRIPGNEPVVSVGIDGEFRAYPIRYLMWHEIVNDTLAGVPVAVTYCPLCNTSVVFERTLDGEIVTFGTTGKLRHSDLIMYDRREHNWWQQFNGEAIVGDKSGEKLTVVPSQLISFDLFAAAHPNGEVLLPDDRRAHLSGQNPYQFYDRNPVPFLFDGRLPTDINAVERVVLVHPEQVEGLDVPLAVSLSYLNQEAPYEVNGITFTWQEGQASALDQGLIAEGRDVGSVRVFQGTGDTAEQSEWVPYIVTFAFAARAFYPDLEIVQLEG